MSAFEIPGHSRFSLDAAAALERNRFVKVDSNGKAAYATTGKDPIVGVTYTEAKADTPVSITGDGIVMVCAASAIAAGDFVGPSTDGKAAKDAGSYIALTAATAANEEISVDLNVPGAAGSTGATG